MGKRSQDITQQTDEINGQAQIRKDDNIDNQVRTIGQSVQNTSSKLAGQATALLQQTGEQVKNIAQEAASVVKNTLGINNESSTNKPPSLTAKL